MRQLRVADLRYVLRTGFRYALASNSIAIARFCIASLLIWFTVSRVNDAEHRWEAVLFGITGGAAILLLRRWANTLRIWIDRKFFREAYDAEKILGELAGSVLTIRDRRQLLETIVQQADVALHPTSMAVLLEHDGYYTVAHSFGTGLSEPATIHADSAILRFLKMQKTAAKINFDDPQSWVHGMSELDQAMLQAIKTTVLIPITVDSHILGILSLGQKRSEVPYTRPDLRLLTAVASQTGMALENARLTENIRREIAQRERLNRELEIAREVQQRLFPQKLPLVTGLDFAGYCRPALGVGGDYYDFIRLDDGCLGLAIGDVSGKGIAAALLMASLQASLRAQTIRPCETLAEMIQNVNRLVYESSAENRYATFFYAQYDPMKRDVRFVNAGHNAPLLYRPSEDNFCRLEDGGTVLGLFPQAPYNEGKKELRSGDILVGFTDGVSEAMNSGSLEFGEERLVEAIRKGNARSAADLISSILSEVDAFTKGAPQHDDMTLLVVRAY